MGLVMSDPPMVDPMLDTMAWMQDSLRDWSYAVDATDDADEHEATDHVA